MKCRDCGTEIPNGLVLCDGCFEKRGPDEPRNIKNADARSVDRAKAKKKRGKLNDEQDGEPDGS